MNIHKFPFEFKVTNVILPPIIVLMTAQKMKFSIKDFLSKCDQIRIGFIVNFEQVNVCSLQAWTEKDLSRRTEKD